MGAKTLSMRGASNDEPALHGATKNTRCRMSRACRRGRAPYFSRDGTANRGRTQPPILACCPGNGEDVARTGGRGVRALFASVEPDECASLGGFSSSDPGTIRRVNFYKPLLYNDVVADGGEATDDLNYDGLRRAARTWVDNFVRNPKLDDGDTWVCFLRVV